jgi:hypothetical protein
VLMLKVSMKNRLWGCIILKDHTVYSAIMLACLHQHRYKFTFGSTSHHWQPGMHSCTATYAAEGLPVVLGVRNEG